MCQLDNFFRDRVDVHEDDAYAVGVYEAYGDDVNEAYGDDEDDEDDEDDANDDMICKPYHSNKDYNMDYQ